MGQGSDSFESHRIAKQLLDDGRPIDVCGCGPSFDHDAYLRHFAEVTGEREPTVAVTSTCTTCGGHGFHPAATITKRRDAHEGMSFYPDSCPDHCQNGLVTTQVPLSQLPLSRR